MSKYNLKVNYDIQSIAYKKQGDEISVDIPIINNKDELYYGLEHVKNKLYKNNIYPSEMGFEIMILATMVYLADTRIARIIHGQDSWTREIAIELPVVDVDIWSRQIDTITRMLQFLTGDIWRLNFVKRDWMFAQNTDTKSKNNTYCRASLFSGGMDSLISTINLMEKNEDTLLFGHAGEGLTKNAQINILNELDVRYSDRKHTLIDLWMSFQKDFIPEGGNDNNTRSRSFLFIGFAVFAITGTDNIKELLVPENGLIALNVPLDITRVGSFSTRTTHPFYLHQWNVLLADLGLGITVKNPYWDKTKGEMADECLNKKVLFEAMKLSFSCSSPGKSRWKGLSPQHCGYCVPCLIRRAAMYKAFGNDGSIYTETSIKRMRANSSTGIGIQLRSFDYAIKKVKDTPNIERLYIHKSGPLHGDENYLKHLASVYRRGLMEVDAFIQESIKQEEKNDI